MKKILLAAAGLLAMVASADSYLYWMVDEETIGDYTWNSARIFAVDSSWDKAPAGGFENYSGWDIGDSVGTSVSSSSATFEGAYALIGSEYLSDAYSYYIELYNDDVAVAHSSGLSYSAARFWTGSDFDTSSGWTASSFTAGAVPEPTSGMLMLLGGALLGLRRRRRAA